MSTIEATDARYWQTPLDCGHPPTTPRYFHDTGVALTTGRCVLPSGSSVCYDCANRLEADEMHRSDRFFGYLNDDAKAITTWPGGHLARVLWAYETRHNIGGTIWRFRAVDTTGAEWYGTSPGPAMYCRLRRAKTKTRAKVA